MSIQKTLALALVASLVAIAVPVSAETSVASVVVTPATATINLRQTVDLDAVAYDADGNVTAATFNWSSSQDLEGFVTVNADGVFKPRKAGTATVTANASGVLGTATVTVSDKLVTTVAITDVANADGSYPPLQGVRGTATFAFQDGTSPGVTGVTVYFRQVGPAGLPLRATYVQGATDASGVVHFEAPKLYDLPGDYVVTVSGYDGANSGTASTTYRIA